MGVSGTRIHAVSAARGGRSAYSTRPTIRLLQAITTLVTLSYAAVGAAGNISIQLTPVPQVRDGVLSVQLTVRNAGDEPAHSTVPALGFRDQTVRGDVTPILRPNESIKTTLEITADALGTGRWPYRIAVDYADANEYPFHALHVGTVMVGAPPPMKVALVGIEPPPLASSGDLKVRVKNLSADARTVTVDVHLPEGVELEGAIAPAELEGWEERPITVPLINRTGLAGSRYAIFVAAEYDDGPVHQAVVVPATLEIVAEQSIFEQHRTLFWVLAGGLVVAWGIGIGWWLISRRRATSRGSRR